MTHLHELVAHYIKLGFSVEGAYILAHADLVEAHRISTETEKDREDERLGLTD